METVERAGREAGKGGVRVPARELASARRRWMLLCFFLVLSAYVIPFTVLTGVTKVYGAFLFWTLFALAAIAAIILITGRWRD